MKFVSVSGTQALFSIWDTRVQDYAAYAEADLQVDGAWRTQQKDGVPAGNEPNHPVVGVSWDDAHAFCQWLTEKEKAEEKLPKGMKYRLPTDEEWSRAVGLDNEAGATPAEKSDGNGADFPWGVGYPPVGKLGNYADAVYHARFPIQTAGKGPNWIVGYDDGFATTSPVGSFPANVYGLYDMGGNVWQWCEDWFDKDQGAPMLRGASWFVGGRERLLLSYRLRNTPGARNNDIGFRCVLAPLRP